MKPTEELAREWRSNLHAQYGPLRAAAPTDDDVVALLDRVRAEAKYEQWQAEPEGMESYFQSGGQAVTTEELVMGFVGQECQHKILYSDTQGAPYRQPASDCEVCLTALLNRVREEAWDTGHICGREKSPTYKENKELRDLWERAEEDGLKLVNQARAEERKRCADIVRGLECPCPNGATADILRRIEAS